jgi:hypothetical protein|tara:strand:+ start:216 stop:455 length:240 start_codon:yes stop_codon:yes gene_type:complete
MIDKNIKKLQYYIQDVEALVDEVTASSDDQLLFCAALVSVVRNIYLTNLGVEQTNMIFEQLAQNLSMVDDFHSSKPTIH